MSEAGLVQLQEASQVGLVSNRIVRSMPPDDRRALLGILEQVYLPRGQSLVSTNGVSNVYFPEDAVIALVPTQSDGPGVGITLIGHDGMVGIESLLGGNYSVYRPVVELSGQALTARADAMEQLLARSPAVSQVIRQYTWTLLAGISRQGVCCGRHSLEQRLCSWLLQVGDRLRSDDLPLTHEAISRRLGLRRAGITVATGILHRKEVVRHRRGHIQILDRAALEATACPCYRILREISETPIGLV